MRYSGYWSITIPYLKLRPTLIVLLAASLGVVLFAIHMLMTAQIGRWERQFDDDVRLVVSDVKHKLDTNEVVLSGFSAFLQAVDRGDTEAARRYAATTAAAYPHIYMIEVARRVPVAEEAAFEASLREGWRSSFKIKDFPGIAYRAPPEAQLASDTWPIVFMYPSLPEAQAIYGTRLETVSYLSHSLALALGNSKPVASPVFELFEGGRAYILLQEVSRPAQKPRAELDFFGSTMTAMVLIKVESLLSEQNTAARRPKMHFSAFLTSATKVGSLLFERGSLETAGLNTAFLPKSERQIYIDNASQPVAMRFERQLLWSELLSAEMLTMLAFVGGALFLIPWLMIRHYLSLDQAALEHERSAYLATHDLLTGLPNRFLFVDRFRQARINWQRNGKSFALLLLDLDHFKSVNDSHGHEVGDQVLIAAAQRMTRELRSGDTVARHGGDEFVILLVNILNMDDAQKVGEKLLASIAGPIDTAVGSLSISCSIGIAICPPHGEDLDVLRKHADQAMYQSKAAGRNCVTVFTAELLPYASLRTSEYSGE